MRVAKSVAAIVLAMEAAASSTHVQALLRWRPQQRRRRPLRQQHSAFSGADFESDNPQNVPPPLVVPRPEFGPLEAVQVQLAAAKANNTPRADHGVHTLYEFCADAGSMERSRFFGFSKASSETSPSWVLLGTAPAEHAEAAPRTYTSPTDTFSRIYTILTTF